MKSKKILAAASLNAGAETLTPVVRRLRKQGVQVRVLSYRAGTVSFRAMGLEPERIFDKPAHKELREEVEGFKPTAVLTGTQVQDEMHPLTIEQMLWNIAEANRVCSVAVLDTRANYAERFSDMDPDDSGKMVIVEEGRLRYLPTRIAVMDSPTKRDMVELGFPGARIEVTGSPYYEYVLEEASRLSPGTRAELLAKPVFSSFDFDGKMIVFMSDSIESFYPDIGFTEKSVLRSFLKIVDKVANRTGMKVNVIVRPHPFRNENAKEAYECETTAIKKAFHNPVSARGSEPDNEYSMEELLCSADVVAGTFNNPLETAIVIRGDARTPVVINYLPGITKGYTFQDYLAEQGTATRVTDEGKLGEVMEDALSGKLVQKPMEAVKGAIDRVIGLLE